MPIVHLPDRTVLIVAGDDAESFLQGLISNDVRKAAADLAVYSMLLTPQGKYLFDFLILRSTRGFHLDVARDRAEALQAKLTQYRLRAKVTIAPDSGFGAVHAVWDQEPPQGALAVRDPRGAALGWRVYAQRPLTEDVAGYQAHRIASGVPDTADFDSDQDFLLDINGEELNAVDFRKGCYVGQELTARMKHRGTARKRLVRVSLPGGWLAKGSPVTDETGFQAGTLRSGMDGTGFALLRLDRADAARQLFSDGRELTRL